MIPALFGSAAEGIAREEALLLAGKPAVFVWRALENAVVVPGSWARASGFEAVSGAAAALGWPLLLRSSGGGAVPQGPCTLNLALILPVEPGTDLADCFGEICLAVSEALRRFEVTTGTGSIDGSLCDGVWNVTAGGRKLAGTAQRWRPAKGRGATALVHAALMMKRPSDDLWPVLKQVEQSVGSKRSIRPEAHVDLASLLPDGMPASAIPGALARAAENRLARFLMRGQSPEQVRRRA